MSMNKTCPISNFTSVEDSVGRAFRSISPLFQSDFFQNSLEARLVTHAIITLINPEPPTCAILILVAFLQRIQCFFLVPESEINRQTRAGRDISFFRQLIQIMKYLISPRTISGDSISVPEPTDIPWQIIQFNCFLELCLGFSRVSFFD